MKKINSIWLYLEPYTFISEDLEYYLFYNTNKKKGFSFKKEKSIETIVQSLQNIDSLYSLRIPIEDLVNDNLLSLIRKIQQSECGDLLEGDLDKPIIMPPFLNLQGSVERLKEHEVSISDNILKYLHEVAIYVNGNCLLNCKSCSKGFKQNLCCTKSTETLDITLLKKFLFSISYTDASISLLGGNIFQYVNLKDVIYILLKMNLKTTIVTDWHNVTKDLEILNLLSQKLLRLQIVVKDIYDINRIVFIAKNINQYNINQVWEIHVTSLEEYEAAEMLIEQLQDFTKVTIKPFYNGINKSFFEKYIFIDTEELESIELTRQNVFALQSLNTNDFGKITILSDGNIYANVNNKPIGTISDSIKNILGKELESKDSWRLTRYELEPCSKCRFKLICPSLSNYERVMKKNNLCYIFK